MHYCNSLKGQRGKRIFSHRQEKAACALVLIGAWMVTIFINLETLFLKYVYVFHSEGSKKKSLIHTYELQKKKTFYLFNLYFARQNIKY